MLKQTVLGMLIAGIAVTVWPDSNRKAEAIAVEAEEEGHRLVLAGRWDEAERVLRTAMEDATGPGSERSSALLEARLGYALTHRASHRGEAFEPAITLLELAVRRARETEDRVTEANGLAWLAQAHYHRRLWYEQGDYEEVFKLYSQAYALRLAAHDDARLGESLFQMGIAEERRGFDDKAADYYRRSLAQARSTSDWLLASFALRHLTYLNSDDLSPEEVLENHQQVLAWREREGFAVGILYGNLTVANHHMQQDLPERARPHIESACATAVEIGSRRGRVSCDLARARLARLTQQTSEAKQHCSSALQLARELAMPRLVDAARECHDSLDSD